MNALAIVGCCIGGALVGGVIGATRSQGADDLGIGLAFDAIGGVIVGGFLGVVVGAVVFA